MEHMNRLILCFFIFLLPLGAGCMRSGPASSGPAPRTLPAAVESTNADGSSNYALIIKVSLTSIEVPLGMASGSEEIWSYLDEERTKAVRSAALGRNGIRVGLADSGAWPDLARILQRMTGQRLDDQSFVALPGKPFQVELKTNQPPQTIFTSYADRTVSGADYPSGDNLLAVSCTIDENDPSRMILTVLPQIRTTLRTTDVVRQQSGLAFVEHPATFSFHPATFQLSMTSNDILVIGPGAESRRPTTLGYHFLLRDKQNMQFETVLVMALTVVKAPLRSSPAWPS